MKTLKNILEGILQGQDKTLEETIDLNILIDAKSEQEFNAKTKLISDIVKNSSKGPFNSKQLKKGKSYIFIWQYPDFDDEYGIAFVDKFPISDGDYLEDMYYGIYWDDYYNNVEIKIDDTGNEFTTLLQQPFGGDSMDGAYEMPKEFVKSMKELIKQATGY